MSQLRTRWTAKRLAMLLSVLVALTVIVPTTLAYVVERTSTIYNTFSPVGGTDPISAQVEVDITKTVKSKTNKVVSPEGFRFCLVDDNGDEYVLTSDAFGKAATTLVFTALDDADQTYHYRLYEIKDGAQHMVYDKTVYDVSIFVKQDPQTRQLLPEVTVNGELVESIAVSFRNVYAPPVLPPPTGDHFQLALCMALMLMSALFAVQLMRKPKEM